MDGRVDEWRRATSDYLSTVVQKSISQAEKSIAVQLLDWSRITPRT